MPLLITDNDQVTFDLTQVAMSSEAMFTKKAGISMKARFYLSAGAMGVKLNSFQFLFHNLQTSGSAVFPLPLGESIETIFRMQISSFSGFPQMLPILQSEAKGTGASISDAQGNPKRLQVQKFQIQADGMGAGMAGSMEFAKDRSARLQLNTMLQANWDSLREYLPKSLPMQIATGSLEGTFLLTGTWIPEAGIEKSPLFFQEKQTQNLAKLLCWRLRAEAASQRKHSNPLRHPPLLCPPGQLQQVLEWRQN